MTFNFSQPFNLGVEIRVIQVSNISPSATREQVYSLFSYIGRIEECKLYPSSDSTETKVKFAYIKFDKDKSVALAQHLTNVVFIDRALTCVPAPSNIIPDEEFAMQMGGPAMPGLRSLPPNVVNQEQDVGDGQIMIFTNDPNLTALGLPPYPPLPLNTEPAKIEEIRRTIYVGNLDKECDVRSYSPYSSSPRRRRTPSPRRNSPSVRRRTPSPRRRARDSRSRTRSPIRRHSKSRDHHRRRSKSRDRRSVSRSRRSRSRDSRSKKRSSSRDKDRKSSKSSKDTRRDKDRSRKDRKRSRSRTPKKDRKKSKRDRKEDSTDFEEESLRERLLERVKNSSKS